MKWLALLFLTASCMAGTLEFPRYHPVTDTDLIVASNWNELCDCFITRMQSGVGDSEWRAWYKLWTVVRNFMADTNIPSDIWFEKWQHVNNPTFGPTSGENMNNPLMMFIHGLGPINKEADRLNGLSGSVGGDADAVWDAGKIQRGWYEPTTQTSSDSAMDSARLGQNVKEAMALTDGLPYLTTYGGYLATATNFYRMSDLMGTNDVYIEVFTNALFTGDDRYTVTNLVATNVYLFTQYLLGPHQNRPVTALGAYTGQNLGKQIDELMQWYISEFVGDKSFRSNETRQTSTVAFDWEKFFTTQYRLAPSYANCPNQICVSYPGFAINASDTWTYTSHDGFNLAGFIARASTNATGAPVWDAFHLYYVGDIVLDSPDCYVCLVDNNGPPSPSGNALWALTNCPGCFSPVQLIVFTNGGYNQTVTLTTNSQIVWIDAEYPNTTTNGRIWKSSMRGMYCTNLTLIASNCQVSGEVAELLYRKPSIIDAYSLMRHYAQQGVGLMTANAKQYSDSYFTNGCLIGGNVPDSPTAANPIYEQFRLFTRDYFRFFKRWSDDTHSRPMLVDYTTNLAGHSVLTFHRTYRADGIEYDAWDGIGPPLAPTPSGQILSGVVYWVSNAVIRYHGSNYSPGQYFTGAAGFATYTGSNGLVATAGQPYQIEGIIPSAPAQNVDNNWDLFITSNAYGNEGAGIGPIEFGDNLAFLQNRSLFLNGQFDPPTTPADLSSVRWLIDPTARLAAFDPTTPVKQAEAPSYFNYTKTLNWIGSTNFFKSLPLYPETYHVISATNNGDNIVITLDRRLQNTVTNYRTDENIIQDFLCWQTDTNCHCPLRTGDTGATLSGAAPAVIHGSCMPRFYFTRMPPKVFTNPAYPYFQHTRTMAKQAQYLVFLLSAMCEGWIDTLSCSTNCETKSCYTYENLCYWANHTRGMGIDFPLGQLETPQYNWWWIKGKDVSFGPISTMYMRSWKFNDIGDCVNQLVYAPIEPQLDLEYKPEVYWCLYHQPADMTFHNPGVGPCNLPGIETCCNASDAGYVLYWNSNGIVSSIAGGSVVEDPSHLLSAGAWTPYHTISAQTYYRIYPNVQRYFGCGPTTWQIWSDDDIIPPLGGPCSSVLDTNSIWVEKLITKFRLSSVSNSWQNYYDPFSEVTNTALVFVIKSDLFNAWYEHVNYSNNVPIYWPTNCGGDTDMKISHTVSNNTFNVCREIYPILSSFTNFEFKMECFYPSNSVAWSVGPRPTIWATFVKEGPHSELFSVPDVYYAVLKFTLKP